MNNKTDNKFIESPWLTPREAAEYCKVSIYLFNQKRRLLPIKSGGTKRRPRFHKMELDLWMEKGFDIVKSRKYDKQAKYKRNHVALLD